MLIKNIEVVDHHRLFKETIYRISNQINSNLRYSFIGAVHIFIIHLIITLPYVSILFKDNDCFPPIISKSNTPTI